MNASYVKLQQAYISEAGTVLGNYKIIGYSTPGEGNMTTNFNYTEAARTWDKNTVALTTTAITNAWQAKYRVKLNDCAIGQAWSVSVAASSTNAGEDSATTAGWKVSVIQGAGTSNQELVFTAAVNGAGCTARTPTFDKVGK